MSTDTSVKKSIIVNVPIAHAFEVFTRRFDLWWPKAHHLGKVDMKEVVLEGREGGRWYEKGIDGSECEWGKVLAWSPPNRVAVSWNIDGNFVLETDPSRASRVDVTFHDEGGNKTRVELEHSELDRHSEWQKLKEGVGGPEGWPAILEMFAAKANNANTV
jgi:uncharacterized protein YndB with AHSA1/START domain